MDKAAVSLFKNSIKNQGNKGRVGIFTKFYIKLIQVK